MVTRYFFQACLWVLGWGGQWYWSVMRLCFTFNHAGDIHVPSTIKMSGGKVVFSNW